MLKPKPTAGTDSKSSLAEQKLIAAAGDHGAALRSALTDLEDALQAKKKKRILDAARTAMTACDRYGDVVTRERLRPHIRGSRCRRTQAGCSRSEVNAVLCRRPRMKDDLRSPVSCPVCRARFRSSSLCPRCGADLTALMLLATHAYVMRRRPGNRSGRAIAELHWLPLRQHNDCIQP
jgi:hypothetical protein